MEKTIKQFEQQAEEEQSILEDRDVKDFIKRRNIQEEDREIIEKLYEYPREFFIVYHNLYNFAGEKTARVLDQHIRDFKAELEGMEEEKSKRSLYERAKLKQKIEMTQLLLDLVVKYDWHTVRHLNGLLEEKAKYETHI